MVEFCIYTPGERDYWGQFETSGEMMNYLKENFPMSEYDNKSSSEHKAFYRAGQTIIIVTGGNF